MSQEESVTDQELFNEAISDTPSKVEAEAPNEESAPVETKEERQRDEKGRFTAKAAEEQPVAAEEPVVEAAPVKEEKPDHRVPLMELLNEREKRQNEQRQREALQQQLWQLQQQIQAAQQPQEPIDIFADPNAYQAHVQQTVEQRLRAMEGNFSLRLAAYKHGDLFQEAWQGMIERTQMGDDSMRMQVLQSPDPGETLVQLYQKEKLMKEVGPDPAAYFNQKKAELLNDDEFLKQAYEAFKAKAGAQPTQTRNKIELPPSLNKVASAGKVDSDGDMSGGSLYHYATR